MKWTMFVVEKIGVAYSVTVYLEVELDGWGAWCSATSKLDYVFSTMEEVREFIDTRLSPIGEENEIQKTK